MSGALAGLAPGLPQSGLLAGMDSDLTPKQKRQALGQSLLRASAAMWGPSGPGSFGASIGAGINAGLDSLNDQSQRRQARQLAAMRYAQTMGPTAEMRNWAQMTQGLSNEDKIKATKVRLGLEGRASGAGIGFGDFVGADGIKRLTRQNPQTGVLEVLYNNQWLPAGGGQGAMPGQAPGSGAAAPQLPQMDSPVV
ncbi:hypothetical protein [Lysobacter enzymogenes]|uniref:hypothetical protein n=1 Tax=Lysobacter enzymogenes TaxID=69 RepID=UPI00111653BD|nr:hypothetical protein [Lysobacter enzymogenes]UZW62362.1 hypothetical protein BV903_008770 [Lysobacter enzymogenes]